jgi:hypothetical protein
LWVSFHLTPGVYISNHHKLCQSLPAAARGKAHGAGALRVAPCKNFLLISFIDQTSVLCAAVVIIKQLFEKSMKLI